MNTAAVSKPRVIGLVGLSIIGGILGLLGSVSVLALLNSPDVAAVRDQLPAWIAPVTYLSIALAILEIVSGVLIMMYKRLGLLIGAAIWAVNIILNVILVATNVSSIGSIAINTLISLAVLYYIYRYLTHEPEKSFFS